MSPIKVPNPTTSPSGYVRIPAPPHDACPKCDAMNTDRVYHVFRVADERGAHFQCEQCAHSWV